MSNAHKSPRRLFRHSPRLVLRTRTRTRLGSRLIGLVPAVVIALAMAMPAPADDGGKIDLEQILADAYERHLEEVLKLKIERELRDGVEQTIEEQVEEQVEETVTEQVEDEVSDAVEESIEQTVENNTEGSIEAQVEERIAETLEEQVEELIDETVEASIEEDIAASVEGSIGEAIELYTENQLEESVIDAIINSTEEQVESRIEAPEHHLSKEEWLVMAEERALRVLADNGYVFDRVTRLDGLGLQLAEVSAPASFDITEVRAGVLDVVGSDFAQVDINHLYAASAPTESTAAMGFAPGDAMDFPADTAGLPLRIGMIDTAVDMSHAAFERSRVNMRHFGRGKSAAAPEFHGTAIASMLSAHSDEFNGIAPQSQLYAASVFEVDSERGEVASTASLVKALDWLTREGVEVINISLAGPPNRLLEAVLARVSEKGIPVLAAAGNAGPASEPLYPAAYDTVAAITAVQTDGTVFRLANRGQHLDLSAPGVDIRHAEAGGGYQVSSGTSFAVPFASVAVARLRTTLRTDQPDSDVLARLYQSALDLGPPGKDVIYGHGLLNPLPPQPFADHGH